MANFYNPYYQPYQMPMPQQMQQPIQQPAQQPSGVVWVDSDADAMNHIVMPNSCVTMRSTDGKTVYFKSADASGKPTIEVYSLQPRQAEKKEEVEYVTREEFLKAIELLKGKKKEESK